LGTYDCRDDEIQINVPDSLKLGDLNFTYLGTKEIKTWNSDKTKKAEVQ